MRLLLMGPPGAGKGTQAAVLSEVLKIPHISTGDMFRKAVREETPMGMEAKRYMDSGGLVPDEVTVGIVRERLALPDCGVGFMLDGFPRTVAQGEALEEMMKEAGVSLDAALNIAVEDEALISRLTGRRTCKDCGALYHMSFSPPAQAGKCDTCAGQLMQRSDDEEETVRKRLEVYQAQTLPLIEFYRDKGVLKDVDGAVGQEQVTMSILDILEKR